MRRGAGEQSFVGFFSDKSQTHKIAEVLANNCHLPIHSSPYVRGRLSWLLRCSATYLFHSQIICCASAGKRSGCSYFQLAIRQKKRSGFVFTFL